MSKKLINHVATCVEESLEGFVALNPSLRLLAGQPRVVIRADIEDYIKQRKVTTLTGGGSGHEPSFMGFVGEGMMSAAVHGSIFASPSATTILAALKAVGQNNPAGVIVVINNYTGDRLNFGMAVERARIEGIKVEIIVNAEDCSITNKDKTAGRRGLTALVFIMKIVGCLAERGERIEHIVRIATEVTKQVGTMGVCLYPCSLPGGGPLFQLGENEIELGMGIHGEAGVRRVQLTSAHDVVKQIITHMTDDTNISHLTVRKGDKLALLVNNLGSTSELEMNIIVRESILFLENELGVRVDRAYASKYTASMEMAGFSITLMQLNGERINYLDSAVKVTSWIQPLLPHGATIRTTPTPLQLADSGGLQQTFTYSAGPVLSQVDAGLLKRAMNKVCDDLIQHTEMLNDLDSTVGDGDCGTTLTEGASAILALLKTDVVACNEPHRLFLDIAVLLEQSMGGTSGALYSLLMTSASQQLSSETTITSDSWIRALKCGVDVIRRYGGAEPGYRTMLDPLFAAWKYANDHAANVEPHRLWTAAVDTARLEAENTAQMSARAGRASYVCDELLTRPDAGAIGCVIWMTAALNVYLNSDV